MHEKISIVPVYQVCIDNINNGNLEGRLYCGCITEGKSFVGVEKLLLDMEEIMDKIAFPRSTVDKRTFTKNDSSKLFQQRDREVLVAMRKFNTDEQVGEKATFVLEVQFRQNASWQGNIRWVEKGKTEHFESALQMIKIIDRAVAEGYTVEVLDA